MTVTFPSIDDSIKKIQEFFIECYAETSGNFSAFNIREQACHTEELNRRYAAAREENVHLPYEHNLTTGSSVWRNMMQFEGEMDFDLTVTPIPCC